MRDGRNCQDKTKVKAATGEIVKAKQVLNAELQQTSKQMTADFPNPGKRERVKQTVSGRLMGAWSWCTAHATALAVGLFRGRGCERSELPCLSFGGGELGRRSWSFYPNEPLGIKKCLPQAV